jgi:hypothetical protein
MDFEYETKRTRLAKDQFADILAIQRREAETGDPYMVGLYNGMAMMCANIDCDLDWQPMQAKAPAVAPSQVPAELTDEQIYSIYETINWGEMGAGIKYARAIEREVRLPAVREARNEANGQLSDERITEISRAHRNGNGMLLMDLSFARAIEHEVSSSVAKEACNKVLTEVLEEIERVKHQWIDGSNRDAAEPLLNEAMARIRKLKSASPAASKGGDTDA